MSNAHGKHHGDLKYFLVDEELFVESPQLDSGLRLEVSLDTFINASGAPLPPFLTTVRAQRLFRFGRMFRRPNLPEFRPSRQDLIDLGKAMRGSTVASTNQRLPAGYTALGQFIDHDMTFNATESLSFGAVDPDQAQSKRSPTLDLDSLYGYPPLEDVKKTDIGRHVYQSDGVQLAVGSTIHDDFVNPPERREFPNDLPRGGNPLKPAMAMIIDPRNDENTAIAQTHLAFIKFHNAVVQLLTKDSSIRPEQRLEKARATVVRHYQLIVLEDYLPRIIEPIVLRYVLDNGCEHFVLGANEEPFMPVEFSVAAFRLGHPLVTQTYEWNKYFQSVNGNAAAKLDDLFNFTGDAGNLNFLKLPSSWIIDWSRFFELSGPGIPPKRNSFARRIGPSVIPALTDLPFLRHEPEPLRSLPVRNLLRGKLLGLPTAQSVAERLGITALTADEISAGPHRAILRETGFDRLTPLWYYILRESEFSTGGERLGPLGSRIVAETFVQLIKSSAISILPRTGNGRPVWSSPIGIRSMPDLLSFVNTSLPGEDFLNPLGD